MGRLLLPMHDALAAEATADFLDRACKAMQVLRVPGQVDSLRPGNLKYYLQVMPTERAENSKKKGAAGLPRWKGVALVKVAEMIKKNVAALRRALRVEEPMEQLPTAMQEISDLKKELMEKENLLNEAQQTIALAWREQKKAKDAHAVSAKRLKLKNRAVTEARHDERDKTKEKVKEKVHELCETRRELKEEYKSKVKKAAEELKSLRSQLIEKFEVKESEVVAQCEEKYESKFQSQRQGLNKARARARDAEEATKKEHRRVRKLQKKIEKLEQESSEESEMEVDDECDEEVARLAPSSPALPFNLLARRDERGRWQAEAPEIRALRLAQLARGVAPSTVSLNIQDVLSLVLPNAEVASMCERQNKLLRGEVTLCGEAMAAWKFASSKRVLSFGWDESTKFGDSVFACNIQLEYYNGSVEDVCLRGLSILPEGGKSPAVLAHIEKRIFAYSRSVLIKWIEKYKEMSGGAAWPGPSPDNIGLHRLSEDTVLMTDTCNGARCTKRMLAQKVMDL